MLRVVHNRVIKEECDLAGESPPGTGGLEISAGSDVATPLLRLVHGLPGSGKSKLIALLKRYFEEVWQWTRNNQYALVAPMNTMADNIGGSTMHSFGRIPFKDRRGTLINSSGESKSAGMFGSPDDWHELRFLLIDEVEAAGCSLLGRLEENLRLQVPSTNAASEGLRARQHGDRCRRDAFAGVNVLCFGDFLATGPDGRRGHHVEPDKEARGPVRGQDSVDVLVFRGRQPARRQLQPASMGAASRRRSSSAAHLGVERKHS